QSGYTPKNNELNSQIGVPYFKVSDMNLPENQTYMLKTTLFSKNQKLKVYKSGSIIFPKNGGAVFTNKKRILTMDSIVDLNTSVLTPYFLIGLNYLYYFMLSIDLGKFTKGTALPTIDSASFNNTP
ncbi:restriction endonuclease subunit S, partial [Campylobacter sp. LR286c]